MCAHAQGEYGCCVDMHVLQGARRKRAFVLDVEERKVDASPEVRLRPSNSDETDKVRRKNRKTRTLDKLSEKEPRCDHRTPITEGPRELPDRTAPGQHPWPVASREETDRTSHLSSNQALAPTDS